MSPNNNAFWDTEDLDNYRLYLKKVVSLIRAGYQREGNPISKNDIKGLAELVLNEHQVTRVSHFDEDGHKIEGMFETYVKYRYK